MNKPNLLRKMKTIRSFETEIGQDIIKGKIITPCHLSIGQEAVAVGVCAALDNLDVVYGTHRSHALYLAKGGNIDRLRDEIYGKETGCMNGRGGSMHLKYPQVGFIMSSPIVGGTIPLAVGHALSFKMQKENNVAVAFLGDGATNEGVFWESINFAVLHKLPVIFVVENNLYSVHIPFKEHSSASITMRAYGFGITFSVAENDPKDIYIKAKVAVNRARNDGGPTLLEVVTYRFCGHVGPKDNIDIGIRNKKEFDDWVKKDPIKRLENELR